MRNCTTPLFQEPTREQHPRYPGFSEVPVRLVTFSGFGRSPFVEPRLTDKARLYKRAGLFFHAFVG
jgi:hypothetical protein